MLYKRLNRAIFRLPAVDEGKQSLQIDGGALATLLAGVARTEKLDA